MTVITSNGRIRQMERERLVIPGKCVVDFQQLTVLKDSSSSPDDIDPRLAILLDIFYLHRNNFLSLEQIANLQYGYSESGSTGAVKADIGKLRALIGDKKPFTVIVQKSGLGYKFVFEETTSVEHLTLESAFKRLCEAGEIRTVCVATSDGSLVFETTSSPSANAVCDFFVPDAVFSSPLNNSDKEEVVCGRIHTSEHQLQSFYRQTSMLIDRVWVVCRENVRDRLIRVQKLKGITAFSAPLPQKLEELDAFPVDANKMLDLILNKLVLEIEKMMAESVAMHSFMSNARATLTTATALDGVVAVSLMAMYFLSCGYNAQNNEVFLQDADRYKTALQKKIREVFFTETSPQASDLDVFISICKAAKEAMNAVLSDLDDRRERMEDFDKVFVEQLNLSEILRNSGIRLSGVANSNENESPIKVR